jgi:protein-S-isoprenylcysteine O-methyltransferase Ste14
MSGFNVVDYFFWLLLIIAYVMEAWALVDSLTVQTSAFSAAGKWSKKIWTIILIVATVVGGAYAIAPAALGASPIALLLGILPVAAFIGAAIYLADVRPAVAPFKKNNGGRGGSRSGPYGPW